MKQPRQQLPTRPASELPSDVDSERALLDCLLIGGLKSGEVMESTTQDDFYDTRHQIVYSAIHSMWTRNLTPELPLLMGELEAAGTTEQAGGIGYVTGIIGGHYASPSNMLQYRDKIKSKKVLRDLAFLGEAAKEAAIEAHRTGAPVAEVIDDIMARLATVGKGAASENRGKTRREAAEDLLYLMESAENQVRCYIDIAKIDEVTGGARAGELWILTAETGVGKAQPLNAQVLTPTGYRCMGDLHVGDFVFDENGNQTHVTGVFDRGTMPVYESTLSDGTTVRCTDDHLWKVRTKVQKFRKWGYQVLPFYAIRQSLRTKAGEKRHFIPMAKPVDFAFEYLPLHPYLVGVLLGDGCLMPVTPRLTCFEPDVLKEATLTLPGSVQFNALKKGTYSIVSKNKSGDRSEVRRVLETLGLCVKSEAKFIPDEYKYSTVDNRLEVLRGLLDTDGSAFKCVVEYSSISERLCDDVRFIVQSLGGLAHKSSRIPYCISKGIRTAGQRSYRLHIVMPPEFALFKCRRKTAAYKPKTKYLATRSFESVRYVGEEPVRCISVASPYRTYLTDHCIVTHNSFLALQINRRSCADGHHVLYASGEMLAEHLMGRVVASAADISYGKIRRPELLTSEDRRGLLLASASQCKICRIVDGELSLARIRSGARAMASNKELGCLIVDYDELVDVKGKDEWDQQRILVRSLKTLAMELGMPCFLVSQLRKSMDPQDQKRPTLQRLYGSGAKAKHASVVIHVDRPFVRNLKGDETEAHIFILKSRDGRLGKTDCVFNLRTFRFEEAPAGMPDA